MSPPQSRANPIDHIVRSVCGLYLERIMPLVLECRNSLSINQLPEIMTEEQAASFLGITTKKLRRMAYDKVGPSHFKIGRDHRYRRQTFLDWIAARGG